MRASYGIHRNPTDKVATVPLHKRYEELAMSLRSSTTTPVFAAASAVIFALTIGQQAQGQTIIRYGNGVSSGTMYSPGQVYSSGSIYSDTRVYSNSRYGTSPYVPQTRGFGTPGHTYGPSRYSGTYRSYRPSYDTGNYGNAPIYGNGPVYGDGRVYSGGPVYGNGYSNGYYGTRSQRRGAAIGGAIGSAVGGRRAANIGAAIGSAIGAR